MKKIDINNWKGKKHYEWFKNYPTHFYGVTSRIDVTELVKITKEKKYSFFPCFLYIITKALNNVEEMRLRIINDEVYLFDLCHPAYTVMTDSGVFDNCDNEYCEDFQKFYKETKEAIAKVKVGVDENKSYNDLTRFDQFFFSCLPWIDFTSLSHPMPNDPTVSVPRMCWGKYVYNEVTNRYEMALNIQVTYALVDGHPLSKCFLEIQKLLNEASMYIK